jgi:hypothetical protein
MPWGDYFSRIFPTSMSLTEDRRRETRLRAWKFDAENEMQSYQLVLFHKNITPTYGMDFCDDIVDKFTEEDWEAKHDFIQWLFPLFEPSEAVKPVPPVLTRVTQELFLSCPHLQSSVEAAFWAYADFLGLQRFDFSSNRFIEIDETKIEKYLGGAYKHNQYRVSRVLKSLCLLQLDGLAYILLYHLLFLLQTSKLTNVKANTVNHWKMACFSVFEDQEEKTLGEAIKPDQQYMDKLYSKLKIFKANQSAYHNISARV